MTTWHIAPDPNTDEPTLWHGDRSVIRRSDLRRIAAVIDADELFNVLTSVLAPTDEQKQRIGQACGDPGSIVTRATWWDSGHLIQESISKWSARAVLAALAAAPDPDSADEGVSG